jgi:5'-nucleotidase/UDP-sugar diphosphatase
MLHAHHLSRRQFLKASATTALAAAFGVPAFARRHQQEALMLIHLADTHSAYDAYPRIVTLVAELIRANPQTSAYILFNGDIFELGSAVALRSAGEADWAFLQALSQYAPVIVNIGNHEFDFVSPAEFMREAGRRGIEVIGNVINWATGRLLGPSVTTLEGLEFTIDVVGVATDALNTYQADARPQILLPAADAWVNQYYSPLTVLSDWSVVLSHGGVTADRQMFNTLPEHTLIVGGHNHLTFRETLGRDITYMQNGFRGERVSVTRVVLDGAQAYLTHEDYNIDATLTADPSLSETIARIRAETLTDDDLAAVGTVPQSYTMREAAFWAVETLRRALEADVALLNHTSFGAGLAAGPLPRYRFDEFLRFDNDVMVAEVDGEILQQILARANQGPQTPLEDRAGDFVYATDITPEPGQRYTIVTSSWVALPFNLQGYLGTEAIEFSRVEGVTTKGILAASLAGESYRIPAHFWRTAA